MKKTLLFVLLLCSILLVACSNVVKPIPAGYIARVLTPTGWESETRTAGQVDLREVNTDSTFNVMVLLEATSTTVKEQFLEANADPEKKDNTDHRVTTADGAPLSVDVYVRLMLPDDKKTSDSIFTLVTPVSGDRLVPPVERDQRVQWIMIKDVYERFAAGKIRNNIRAIFASYKSYKEVAADYTILNKKIADMVVKTFQEEKVPLKLQDAQLSNVKQDPSVVKAQNDLASTESQATSIAKIGAAIRANPEYREYMKWEALKTIAGGQKGTNTVIVTDGSAGTDWAKAQYARGKDQ